MQVHIILHHWCNTDEEGQDICGAFSDRNTAIKTMHQLAKQEREAAAKDWNRAFHPDFECDEDTFIAYGWYNYGICDLDCSWSWSLESMEVQ